VLLVIYTAILTRGNRPLNAFWHFCLASFGLETDERNNKLHMEHR
jgi:hypothetical protein